MNRFEGTPSIEWVNNLRQLTRGLLLVLSMKFYFSQICDSHFDRSRSALGVPVGFIPSFICTTFSICFWQFHCWNRCSRLFASQFWYCYWKQANKWVFPNYKFGIPVSNLSLSRKYLWTSVSRHWSAGLSFALALIASCFCAIFGISYKNHLNPGMLSLWVVFSMNLEHSTWNVIWAKYMSCNRINTEVDEKSSTLPDELTLVIRRWVKGVWWCPGCMSEIHSKDFYLWSKFVL